MAFSQKISVVMPVYNTEIPILKEAVDSILNQTFRDFEFIIVDDCSGPAVGEYLQSLKDPRLRLIRNETNLGVTKSLNIGFQAAQGKYIARMDADDISLPIRFEKQFALMESHPEVIVCGANVEVFGARHQLPSGAPVAEKPDMEAYRVKMLFVNPGPIHPTAFFSHEKLLRHHIQYDEKLNYAQDYGMWAEVSQYGEVWKIGEVLLRYRAHAGQVSSVHRQRQIACDQMTQKKLLTELVGPVTQEELDLHYVYSAGYIQDTVIISEIDRWYRRLLAANRKRGIYNQRKLKRYITENKRRLIEQACGDHTPIMKKILLFFRYLPLISALRATGKTMLEKHPA